MYAKLINGVLEPAPENIIKDNICYQNYHLDSNAAMLLEDGYKPVEENQAPTEMKQPQKAYIEEENKIVAVFSETYVEPNYREKRATAYPDAHEYLDAVVKINSGDSTLMTEGNAQLQAYYNQCLQVKALYPKE